MIAAGDFNLYSNRDIESPYKKETSLFAGSHVHSNKWQHTNSTRLDLLKNRTFINDYVYPDHDGKK
jgi:hypothetical protein